MDVGPRKKLRRVRVFAMLHLCWLTSCGWAGDISAGFPLTDPAGRVDRVGSGGIHMRGGAAERGFPARGRDADSGGLQITISGATGDRDGATVATAVIGPIPFASQIHVMQVGLGF